MSDIVKINEKQMPGPVRKLEGYIFFKTGQNKHEQIYRAFKLLRAVLHFGNVSCYLARNAGLKITECVASQRKTSFSTQPLPIQFVAALPQYIVSKSRIDFYFSHQLRPSCHKLRGQKKTGYLDRTMN